MVTSEYKHLVEKEFCPGCSFWFAPVFPDGDPRRQEVREEITILNKQCAAREKLQGI